MVGLGLGLGFNYLLSTPKYLKNYFAARRKLLDVRAKAILNIRNINQSQIKILSKPPYRVLFFGTDDFSVESLKLLSNAMKTSHKSIISHLDVVTCVKSKTNSVQTFALQENLNVYDWPPEIHNREYDMGLVVSFGHLIPENIINSFKLGMLNVHASLLPKYRGAAPIIYAILNGDTETGVTIMQIKPKRFDVGNIVRQARLSVFPDEMMPELSSRLARLGAKLLLETIADLPHCMQTMAAQSEEGVSYAPRVTSSISCVDWQAMSSQQVYDLARALDSLYPVSTKWHGQTVKLLGATRLTNCSVPAVKGDAEAGYVELDRITMRLRVLCKDMRWVAFNTVRLQGKKQMKPLDFYNGYISKHQESDRRFS